jgi:hypothetical protein
MRKVGEVGEKLQRLVCRKQRGMVLRNYVGGLGSAKGLARPCVDLEAQPCGTSRRNPNTSFA